MSVRAAAVALVGLALAGCAVPSGGAQPWAAATVAVEGPDLPDAPEAVAALRRSIDASRSVSYEAVVRVSGPRQQSPRTVVHQSGIGTYSGPHGGSGSQFVPDGDGAALHRTLDILLARFGVNVEGKDRVLGRSATVVVAADASGVVRARFWLDRKTGLLIRRDVFNRSGDVVRSTSYEELNLQARQLPAADVSVSPEPTLDDVAVARLRSEGWVCPEALPGGLELAGADESGNGAVHLIYSDGIEVVSLFVQRGRLDSSMPGMAREVRHGGTVLHSADGAPTWSWTTSGSVVTLITEAPDDVVDRVIAALPPEAA